MKTICSIGDFSIGFVSKLASLLLFVFRTKISLKRISGFRDSVFLSRKKNLGGKNLTECDYIFVTVNKKQENTERCTCHMSEFVRVYFAALFVAL